MTDTRGAAMLINGISSRPIRRGAQLTPGNEIETGSRGRVILSLTDGSQVTIHPNSRVVIEDFRAVPSVRELIRVLAGYVRVKIYHTSKRPNP
ncbi:MAG TPA: FecR domain-containing protein, partial [Blastocatellia bacterium]|nr:FecR domain-containing protein [Blastocatellia bacterium]